MSTVYGIKVYIESTDKSTINFIQRLSNNGELAEYIMRLIDENKHRHPKFIPNLTVNKPPSVADPERWKRESAILNYHCEHAAKDKAEAGVIIEHHETKLVVDKEGSAPMDMPIERSTSLGLLSDDLKSGINSVIDSNQMLESRIERIEQHLGLSR